MNPTHDLPWSVIVAARPKLTAAGLRALGRPVPKSIADHECIVLIPKESP